MQRGTLAASGMRLGCISAQRSGMGLVEVGVGVGSNRHSCAVHASVLAWAQWGSVEQVPLGASALNMVGA